MQTPNDPSEMTPLPPSIDIVEVNNQVKSPSDTISQLSQPSGGGRASLSSPLGAKDIGIPKTPPQRHISSVDEALFDLGYDSDGLRPPWHDTEALDFDGPDLREEPLRFGPAPVLPPEPDRQNVAEKNITDDDVAKMAVSALKTELKNRGISVKGKKEELKIRLKKALEDKIPLVASMTTHKAANLAGDSFSPGAHWELLEMTGNFVEERTQDGLRAPTVPVGEVPLVKKRNFEQKFDRMVFSGKTEVPARYNNNRIKKNKEGKVQYQTQPHEETEARMSFIRANRLSVDSQPVEWFAAFIPMTSNPNEKDSFSIENLNRWTNLRALMENSGGLGGKYENYVNFTTTELMRHIGLYLLQALSPSPQIDMKFHSQKEDPVNGNDFIHTSFGGVAWKSKKRHRHFKAFFTSVNPMLNPPPRESHPNWKVHPFLKHMLYISRKAVFMGRNLSCDEQTIGFQGQHKDKQRITYKREGDGFLADCICSDGYTYAFHFRHQPASEKIIKTYNCSPLHARVLGLISQLPDKYYTLGMDNLYNSAKFCRLAYSMDQKVMVHGVTRPTLRGIPPAIKQNEVSKKKDLERVRHTVKAAVLKGDEVLKDLVSVSLYDTKPVYFLTSATPDLKWVEKEKKVYDSKQKKTVNMPFYRLNIIDFYNHNMGNVDLADQLRNHYRYDSAWHRNRKWWWSIWWWGFQLLLTNSYVLYLKFHRLHDSKQICSHYDYIKEISLAWINPELHWPKKKTKAAAKSKEIYNKVKTRLRKRFREDDMVSASNFNSSKCERVNDASLHPTAGKLHMRLNTSVQHLPEHSKSKKPKCQLHRWARGRQSAGDVSSGVVTCSVCRVNLCITCYNYFHKEAHLEGKKREIADS